MHQDIEALVGETNSYNRALQADNDDLRQKWCTAEMKKAEYVHDLQSNIRDLKSNIGHLTKQLQEAESRASAHMLGSVKILNENLALSRRLNVVRDEFPALLTSMNTIANSENNEKLQAALVEMQTACDQALDEET